MIAKLTQQLAQDGMVVVLVICTPKFLMQTRILKLKIYGILARHLIQLIMVHLKTTYNVIVMQMIGNLKMTILL